MFKKGVKSTLKKSEIKKIEELAAKTSGDTTAQSKSKNKKKDDEEEDFDANPLAMKSYEI